MTAITIIAILLALLIVGFLIVASMKPVTFRVQRSIDANAPADKIYPLISDYKHWASWSPYEKRDPAMKRAFTGAPNEKGAIDEWDGNKISAVAAWKSSTRSHRQKSISSWISSARSKPITSPSSPCYRKVGSQFEKGLANIKAVAER